MTKDEAIAFAGSVQKLADLFGISIQAVYQWPDEQIPRLREYQIYEIIDKLKKGE